VIAVEGPDRAAFLQGQLTQDVRGLGTGDCRAMAGLTPKGKLLYFGRLVGDHDRFLLLLEAAAGTDVLAHLTRYGAFQKVAVRDASDRLRVLGLYGPRAAAALLPSAGVRLAPYGELAAEILVPAEFVEAFEDALGSAGSTPLSAETAEVLRIEAGRPMLGRDADGSNLPDEAGLQDAIAVAKGCYVGQEVVARLRTYGRVNRRLAGLRFPGQLVPAGTVFPNPEKPGHELARVTSSVRSARLGAIGLGYVFRDVADGTALAAPEGASAIVVPLPFA
jgi:folate-binding protein YgfZ